ncbi:MAG: acyl-ACP--UDP-N-acetylglucosamine O-acyltransferase [Planctomycetota bacterium]|jgi:UDP-N-acetylglucosamine acyltransferase
MPVSNSARIHPTALVSPHAHVGDDCEIGPFCILEGRVRLGSGCVVRPHAVLVGPLEMGEGNTVYSGAILGEVPQHLKFGGEETRTVIGSNNIFRENVTVHRGTTERFETRIGDNNFFMAGSHVAHDCIVGNKCILANGALMGGHCQIEDGVFLSGNSAIHQYCRVGRLALLSGVSSTTKDVPPFIIQQHINHVCGINVVGMRRAGIPNSGIDAVRRAYAIIYRDGGNLSTALEKAESELGDVDVVAEMIAFIRSAGRGINMTFNAQQSDRKAA